MDIKLCFRENCVGVARTSTKLSGDRRHRANAISTPTPTPTPTPDSTSASPPTAININKADKALLVIAFKGTRVNKTTIDKLINLRQRKSYIRLESLASDLKFTDAVRKKLQEKLNKGEICF
ncbi:hypothetical protein [Nostoc sp.]